MAFVDRVLTLKIATDTGEINQKLDQTGGKLGKVGSQVAGFAKAAAIGLALEGLDLAVEKIGKGIDDARNYRIALDGLNLTLAGTGVTGQEAADAVDALNARSLELGFDDVETLNAFRELVNLTGDVDAAMVVLEATFDRSRAENKELGTALEETIRLYRGGTRQMDLFNVKANKIPEGLTAQEEGLYLVNAALGQYDQAAENFAASTEGMQERVGVLSDRLFATLGEEILKLTDEIMPVLVDDILPAVGEAFTTVQPFLQSVGESLAEVAASGVKLWEAAEPLRDALAPVVELMGQSFITALETIDGLLNALAQVLTGDLDGAFRTIAQTVENVFAPVVDTIRDVVNSVIDILNSISFGGISVPIPELFIPNPTHGTIFDPVGVPGWTLGGGSWDVIPPFSIDIPKLATGGIVTSPTLALIGEAGPEAVVPLGAGMPGTVINVQTIGDPTAIEDAVIAALRRAGQANGSVVLSRLRPVGVG